MLNDSPSGWKSPAALHAIGIEQYAHDPQDEHWGFTSWNDFFTRRFKDGQRPVASPDDDAVIVNACESTSYGISTDVKRRTGFGSRASRARCRTCWITTTPSTSSSAVPSTRRSYSATNYHRWQAPVAETVVRAFVKEGTYYSEADSEGADATEPKNSQSYLAHVANRAIILIDADDPVIGLVAVVLVGMSDVSSCLIQPAIRAGYHVAKGEELAHFQFGGSTRCRSESALNVGCTIRANTSC